MHPFHAGTRLLAILAGFAACTSAAGAPDDTQIASAGNTGTPGSAGATSAAGATSTSAPGTPTTSSGGGGGAGAVGTSTTAGNPGVAMAGTSQTPGGAAGGGGQPGMLGEGGAAPAAGTGGTAGLTSMEPRPMVVAAPGASLVRVDTATLRQRFEGWGTSLCWWANHVGGWSESGRNGVVDAVVDPVDGLGYNVFRYNIGGGENPSHDHMQQHRNMPGFRTADGTWTWDADANQRAVLLRIAQSFRVAERSTDLVLEAFSNSPPYWMTMSGCASGSNDGSNNLADDSYDEFADYLTEVVRYYRDEHDITFRTLEPLNEPFADWWRANGSQEGCHFDPSSQERIIGAVAQQLEQKQLSGTTISASDENSMDDALRNLRSFDEATLAAIGQLNVHSYAGSQRRELRALANELGKRLWQSESGPLGQDISDDTDAALFMAQRIVTDLRDLEAEAWVDWQSGDPARSWASFTLNDATETFTPLKRFYMHAGFSRYIRPGAQLVDVDDANMVAAASPDGNSVTIVVVNPSSSQEQAYTFDLTTLRSVAATALAFRTSRTEDLEPLEPLPIEGYAFTATVPAYSVTTFVVEMP